jgi:hypothetical protein
MADEYIKHEKTGKEFKLREIKSTELFDLIDLYGEKEPGQLLKEMVKRMIVEPKITEENFDSEVPLEIATALSSRAGQYMKGGGVQFFQK